MSGKCLKISYGEFTVISANTLKQTVKNFTKNVKNFTKNVKFDSMLSHVINFIHL